MADINRNSDVERIIDEQIRQMVQVAKSKEVRLKQQPTNLLEKLRFWWKQNVLMEKYD